MSPETELSDRKPPEYETQVSLRSRESKKLKYRELGTQKSFETHVFSVTGFKAQEVLEPLLDQVVHWYEVTLRFLVNVLI